MSADTPGGCVFSGPPAGWPEGHRRVLSHLAVMLDPFPVRRSAPLLPDPRLVIHGNSAVSTVGRRP